MIRGISDNNSEQLNLISKIGQTLLILFLESRTMVYVRLKTPKANIKVGEYRMGSWEEF